jgi:hypothetical protein
LNLEYAGQTIPNLVVVPLNAGKASLYTSVSTHLIADVAGYFTGALTAKAGRMIPVTPARLLDTRNGTGYSGAKPGAGSTVTVKATGLGGVPDSGVAAVVLNVTVTDAAEAGHVTVWPSDKPRPLASNLNVTNAGQTISNAVWVPLSPEGYFSLYASGSTHLVADVAGWYTSDLLVNSTRGLFVPVEPTRLLETRQGAGQTGYSGPKPPAGSTVSLQLAGRAPIPALGADAVVANLTATESAGPGYLTAYPSGQSPPLASNLNLERAGQTRPNLITSPLGAGKLDIFTTTSTHLIADVAGYFTPDLNPPPAPVQREEYDLADGASFLEPANVAAVAVQPGGGYAVVLHQGVGAPAVGAGVVLKGGGDAYPEGLSGVVSAVTTRPDGAKELTVAAKPVEELFDEIDLAYSGAAQLALVAQGAGAPTAHSRSVAPTAVEGSTSIDNSFIEFPAGAFECDVSAGMTFSAAIVRFTNTRVHFEKHVGLFTTPYVSFYVTTEPIVEVSGEVHGQVTCELAAWFRNSHRLVWVLPTAVPVTVDVAPALKVEATVAGRITFKQHFYRMVGVATNPDLSPHIYNAGSSVNEGVSVVGEVSLSLMLGADFSVKVLDVAGIGVTMGPKFTAKVDTGRCFRLSVSIRADFDLRINLWIKEFRYEFFSLDIGPWEIFVRCLGNPPPGSDVLNVYRADGPAGYYTEVGGIACPPGTHHLNARGAGQPYMTRESDRVGPSTTVYTDQNASVGSHTAYILCEDEHYASLKTYTFAQTITAPARQLDFDRDSVRTGATVVIRDGGGCGSFSTVPQQVHVMIFDLITGGNPVAETKLMVTAGGRWGPARLTIPADHFTSAWKVYAVCDQPVPYSYPSGGGYFHPDVNIGWP